MPKAIVKKIKSAPKPIIILVLLALVAGCVAIAIPTSEEDAPLRSASGCNGLQTMTGCYELEQANTAQKRTKGLSYRDNLAQQTGMLFTFDQAIEQCIWMKDMRFNIDIIWLDSSKNVTKILENVSPSTYPDSFCSPHTKYVIELNVGDVQKNQIVIGKPLAF